MASFLSAYFNPLSQWIGGLLSGLILAVVVAYLTGYWKRAELSHQQKLDMRKKNIERLEVRLDKFSEALVKVHRQGIYILGRFKENEKYFDRKECANFHEAIRTLQEQAGAIFFYLPKKISEDTSTLADTYQKLSMAFALVDPDTTAGENSYLEPYRQALAVKTHEIYVKAVDSDDITNSYNNIRESLRKYMTWEDEPKEKRPRKVQGISLRALLISLLEKLIHSLRR